MFFWERWEWAFRCAYFLKTAGFEGRLGALPSVSHVKRKNNKVRNKTLPIVGILILLEEFGLHKNSSLFPWLYKQSNFPFLKTASKTSSSFVRKSKLSEADKVHRLSLGPFGASEEPSFKFEFEITYFITITSKWTNQCVFCVNLCAYIFIINVIFNSRLPKVYTSFTESKAWPAHIWFFHAMFRTLWTYYLIHSLNSNSHLLRNVDRS